jgi:hypothetical protein
MSGLLFIFFNKCCALADQKVGLSQKEESDLTERWIFAVTTNTDCIYSSTVALYIISMKPLELMKQGGRLRSSLVMR